MTREKLMNDGELRRALGESGMDVAVAVSQPNVFYTSGALIPTQVAIPDRLVQTVLPRDGDDVLLTCAIEEKAARGETWIEDVRSYPEFAESPIYLLARVLKEKGLAAGCIGIEKRYLTGEYYEELARLLPDAKFEACDDLFEKLRSIKTQEEIDRFRRAAVATERAMVEAFQGSEPGQTERALLANILEKLIANGAGSVPTGVLAAGDQSLHAHPKARDRELRQGDLIRAEIGGLVDGYGSDVARTAVVGGASQVQKETFAKIRAVHRSAIEKVKPGMPASDLFEFCVQAYRELGIEYAWSHVGHGFGLAGREMPMLQPNDTRELRPNMLVCVEQAVLDRDLGGYQLKDLVLIKENGAEILTTYSDAEELLVLQ